MRIQVGLVGAVMHGKARKCNSCVAGIYLLKLLGMLQFWQIVTHGFLYIYISCYCDSVGCARCIKRSLDVEDMRIGPNKTEIGCFRFFSPTGSIQ